MSELLGHLRTRVEILQSSMIEITPGVMSESADRWVLASLLQKAVRRNQPELALGAALKLLEMDPARLWRRLLTVALEDVGVGDLATALDLVAISTLPGARRLLGGSRASLEIVLPLACRAIKDRTADHIASLVRWEGMKGGEGRVSSTPSSTDTIGSWQNGVYGAVSLSGAWKMGKLNPEDVLAHFARQEVPLALLEACGCYARRCGDPLFLYVLIGWTIWRKEAPEPLALARQGIKGQDLGGIPDYGLDPLHTRLGRRAVELWLRSDLERVPFHIRQVIAGLWNAEAALCNQTLFWNGGGEVQKAAYEADLLAHGLSLERQEALSAWILRENSVLFAARQMVWRSQIRVFRETEGRQSSTSSWRGDGEEYGNGDGDNGSGCSAKSASTHSSHAPHVDNEELCHVQS
jgi:hypothetical protein